MSKRHIAPEGIHPAKRKRPPMQPLVVAKDGAVRFQANRIVRYLLDHGGLDLNDLAIAGEEMGFARSDKEQFAQLIGYSISGFGELGYVRDRTYDAAARKAAKLKP